MSLLELVAGLPKRPADIRTAASVVLNEPRHLSPLLVQLIRHCLNGDYDGEGLRVLFDCACSGSGTVVKTCGAEDADLGVIVLGYGGSSVDLLMHYEAIYRKVAPTAKILLTTASGLSTDELAQPAVEEQCDRIVTGVLACKRVIIHACSSNGVALWALLLRRHAVTLAERVAAIVYDCAVESRPSAVYDLGPEWTVGWIFNSVWCQVMTHAAELLGCSKVDLHMHSSKLRGMRTSLEELARATVHREYEKLAARRPPEKHPADGEVAHHYNPDAFFWLNRMTFEGYVSPYAFVAAKEPPVPALCLTSNEDSVVLPEAVAHWAATLREAKPGRTVTVETLQGGHCHLHDQGDALRYQEQLTALLASCS